MGGNGAFTEPYIYGTIEVSHFRSRRVVIVRDVCFFIKIGLHTKVSVLPSIRLHRIGIGLQRRGEFWVLLFFGGFTLIGHI